MMNSLVLFIVIHEEEDSAPSSNKMNQNSFNNNIVDNIKKKNVSYEVWNNTVTSTKSKFLEGAGESNG